MLHLHISSKHSANLGKHARMNKKSNNSVSLDSIWKLDLVCSRMVRVCDFDRL